MGGARQESRKWVKQRRQRRVVTKIRARGSKNKDKALRKAPQRKKCPGHPARVMSKMNGDRAGPSAFCGGEREGLSALGATGMEEAA